jgi:signal transduction histidine kinase
MAIHERIQDLRDRASTLPFRVALVYGLLLAATLTFVIGLTLRLVHVYLTRELDSRLLATVTEFRTGPARFVTHPGDLDREASTWLAVHAFAPDETVAVRTADGLVLTTAGGIDLRGVAGARDLLLAEATRWDTLQGPQGPVRMVAVPLSVQGSQVGTLVVAASKTSDSMMIQALAWRIITASLAGLLLALVAGYSAVRRSVHPLWRMLEQVEAIQATGDLRRRLGRTGVQNEVGRLADAFDRMLERLEQGFRSQQRFVADASHELRTPLAVARGHLELLQQQLDDAATKRSLAVATEELDRMARIVNDLLLLARLDEGTPLVQQPVDIEITVREALLRAMQIAPRRTHVDVAPDLHAAADPDRLLQALTNLITNAAIHGGEDVHIQVTAAPREGRAVITVADTGPGIHPKDLPHIFERFFRGSGTRGSQNGVGLGLAITASLVKAMGGEISVESRLGEETRFVLSLPLSGTAPAGGLSEDAVRAGTSAA